MLRADALQQTIQVGIDRRDRRGESEYRFDRDIVAQHLAKP